MKCVKLYWIFILSMFLLPCVVLTQTITRDEFLKQLQQEHPIFDKEILTSEILEEEQKSYLGTDDWNVLTSVNYMHEEPMIAIAGPEKTDAFSVSGGVERQFWSTGGRLSASFSSAWAKIDLDPIFGFPESFYQNQISLSYVHPLLRNKKGFLNRLEYDLKQFEIDFGEVQAKENLEDFIKTAAAKFLDWAFLSEQKKIVIDRLKLSEEELDRIKRKRAANLVDQVDVIRAEDTVRLWTQNRVLIESQWKALQGELAVLAQQENIYKVQPEYDLYRLDPRTNIEEATSQLKEKSRILHVLDIHLDQLQLAREGYKETSKADLSLITEFNIKKYDAGIVSSLGLNKPDAMVGLQYAFPVPNRTAEHKIAKTVLQTTQLEKQKDEIALALTSALTNLHIRIKELENVMALSQVQIQSARKRTEEELKLYNQGRGDLTFVILSRDSEENAKLAYATNALTYHKLILEYEALMDQLY
jgi:outer membrane protein TolC